MNAFERLGRAARRQPHADTAAAAILFAVVMLTALAGPPPDPRSVGAASLLAAVACGVLAARRRWPFAVLACSSAAAEGYAALLPSHQGALLLAAPLIALYSVAECSDRRRSLLIGGLAVLVLGAGHMLLRPSSWVGAENLALAALGGLAVAAGDSSRHRRAYLAEVEARAHRAECDRLREAHRQVTEERLRIARDLHDVVGHHLALINVQAGVAAHVLDQQPEQVRQSLGHIRQASRSALEELRDTIGLLREFDEPEPTGPTAGLDGLGDLIGSFRASGLRVREETTGTARRLPPATDLTAYRVIQEALTNVCRHAGGATARLRLDYRPSALCIVVDNDVSGTAPARPDGGTAGTRRVGGAGHGLVGMRERVTALGGSLRAGPRPGGFHVAATLPLPARAAAPEPDRAGGAPPPRVPGGAR